MLLTMPICLSKSKLLEFRQCELRVWFELRHPHLRHDGLDGVQDGGAGMRAYVEAIDKEIPAAHRQQIERQLLDYLHLETPAMVSLWQFFAGQQTVSALHASSQRLRPPTGSTSCPT